jgi:hypothetical protein
MKMNATEIAARREQIKTTRANIKTVVNIYRETSDRTPAETVAAIVERLGYDTAREAIAEIINTVGEWDGRIYPSSREWAATIENAATRDELEAKSIYQPAEIHPAHINQLAQAMSKYTPPAPEPSEPSAPAASPIRLNVEQFGGVQLPHRVAVYVPSTQGPAETTDNAKQVQRVAREFAEMFGGATATTARGFWVSDAAGLVAESVTIVYASCTDRQYHEQVPEVIRIAQRIKEEMQQEAVSIELDGILYLV